MGQKGGLRAEAIRLGRLDVQLRFDANGVPTLELWSSSSRVKEQKPAGRPKGRAARGAPSGHQAVWQADSENLPLRRADQITLGNREVKIFFISRSIWAAKHSALARAPAPKTLLGVTLRAQTALGVATERLAMMLVIPL